MSREFSVAGLAIFALLGASPLMAQQAAYAEAKTQIDAFWNKKISHCSGQDWYIGFDAGDIQHLRNASWTVQPSQVTQAEAMNGIQWQGSTELQASTTRHFLPRDGGWKGWENGMGFGVFAVQVTKRNGQWSFQPSSYSAINQMFALPCARVPRDPTAQEIQQARAGQLSQACLTAINPGNSVGAVSAFLDSGGDPNTCKDRDGRNLLMILPMQGRFVWDGDALTLVQSGKIDLNAKDRFGYPAIVYLLIRYRMMEATGSTSYLAGYSRVLDAMVSRGAEKSPHWFTPDGKVNWDTIPKDFDFQTAAPANAAHAAPGLFTADLGTARAALSAGADVNQIDPNLDRTPLTWAAENGSTDIATELLQHGADVNLKDRHGWTPLIAATCGTHPGDPRLGLVQLLLSKGADVNARTEKYTPLSCAIENNRGQSVIDLLIPKAGAKGAPNAADSGTPSRIRVGENVQLAKMIRRVPPVYPPLAKQAMVQGVVALNVILNRDGTVQSATVAAGHPLLAPAAIDAVKQWVYQPTTVNGQPVEVVTTATVVFSLAQGPK